MDNIEISLESLKEIVKEAERMVGFNPSATVYFWKSENMANWGCRENVAKASYHSEPMKVAKELYYQDKNEYRYLCKLMPQQENS